MRCVTMKKIIGVLTVLVLLAVVGCANPNIIGGEKDAHGCLVAAGYSWCDAKQKCLRPFEEACTIAEDACQVNEDCIPKPSDCHPLSCINKQYATKYVKPDICTMMFLPTAAYNPEDCACVNETCIDKNLNKTSEKPIGGDKDTHGCLIGAGYSWNETVTACVREWELNATQKEFARIAIAPLSYPVTIISVEEQTSNGSFIVQVQRNDNNQLVEIAVEKSLVSNFTISEALKVAEGSECTDKGILGTTGFYNTNSRTWWLDLTMKPAYQQNTCNPACVVSEDTRSAAINWRCTGLIRQ